MLTQEDIVIPDKVEVHYKARRFTVKGPLGTLTKKFGHLSFSVLKKDLDTHKPLIDKKTKNHKLRL